MVLLKTVANEDLEVVMGRSVQATSACEQVGMDVDALETFNSPKTAILLYSLWQVCSKFCQIT